MNCSICYVEQSSTFVHSVCKRIVCKSCVQRNIKRYVFPTKCPTCYEPMDRSFLSALDAHEKEKFERLETESALQLMGDIQFCTNPLGCSNAMVKDKYCSKMVCSACQFATCTSCGLEWHEETCQQYKSFKLKNSEMFRAYSEYIKAMKCRTCPSCASTTERSEGCNHITCSRCSKQYCYACGGNWEDKHYNCIIVIKLPPAPPVPEELRAWKLKVPIPQEVLAPPPPKPVVRRIPRRVIPRPVPVQTPQNPLVVPEGKQEEGIIPEEEKDSAESIDEWVEVKKERKEKKPKEKTKVPKRRPRNYLRSGFVVGE